jgi:hypothetical protein
MCGRESVHSMEGASGQSVRGRPVRAPLGEKSCRKLHQVSERLSGTSSIRVSNQIWLENHHKIFQVNVGSSC